MVCFLFINDFKIDIQEDDFLDRQLIKSPLLSCFINLIASERMTFSVTVTGSGFMICSTVCRFGLACARRSLPNKLLDKFIRRVSLDFIRGIELHDTAFLHNHDSIGQLQSFIHIMGNEDNRFPQFSLPTFKFGSGGFHG